MRRAFALLLVFLLGTLGAGLGAPPKPSGLPKIGIVSAIGDKFYASKIGLLAFGSDFKEMAIEAQGNRGRADRPEPAAHAAEAAIAIGRGPNNNRRVTTLRV